MKEEKMPLWKRLGILMLTIFAASPSAAALAEKKERALNEPPKDTTTTINNSSSVDDKNLLRRMLTTRGGIEEGKRLLQELISQKPAELTINGKKIHAYVAEGRLSNAGTNFCKQPLGEGKGFLYPPRNKSEMARRGGLCLGGGIIPISSALINKDGVIVDILHRRPDEEVPPQFEELVDTLHRDPKAPPCALSEIEKGDCVYSHSYDVCFHLEMDYGAFGKLGVNVGDKVEGLQEISARVPDEKKRRFPVKHLPGKKLKEPTKGISEEYPIINPGHSK